jgi:hypothetical protein
VATQITCNVSDGDDPDERIDRVGGPGWTKDEDTVIAEIEQGREYFVEVASARVTVLVIERAGRKHLRTAPIRLERPMNKRTLRSLSTSAIVISAVAVIAAPASARDYDCADFPTQAKAQRFFKKHHPKSDPYRLDADHDGIACESNP